MFDNFPATLAIIVGFCMMVLPQFIFRVKASIEAKLHYRNTLEEAFPAKVEGAALPPEIRGELVKLKAVR